MTEEFHPRALLQRLEVQLKLAQDHVRMGTTLPPGTRFARAKGVALRVFQLVTGEQVIFNRAVVAALETAAGFIAAAAAPVVLEEAKAEEALRSMADAHADAAVLFPVPAALPGIVGAPPPARVGARPTAVLLSTFRVGRRFSGGELRAYHLACALAARFDVEIVSMGERAEPPSRVELAPGVTETVVPRSLAHHAVELSYRRDVGLQAAVDDILTPGLLRFTPAYLEEVRRAVAGAALVQLEHPYMFAAIEDLDRRPPLVYDAHNSEVQMKREMLPRTAAGDALVEMVRRVESAAVGEAALIATCSAEDAASLRDAFGGERARWLDTPNGVSLDAVPFTAATERRARAADWLRRLQMGGGHMTGVRRVAVFIATGQPPSFEAAEAIIAAAPELPTTWFLLVGTHAFAFRSRVLPPNVVAVGPVADYGRRLLLAAADAGLNPMSTGSGSNLKVPEYLAAGLPVVATPYGVRGFDVKDGVHLRLAPVDGLAAALEAVYINGPETEEIARRGRALVEERYRWEDIGARLTSAAAEVAGC